MLKREQVKYDVVGKALQHGMAHEYLIEQSFDEAIKFTGYLITRLFMAYPLFGSVRSSRTFLENLSALTICTCRTFSAILIAERSSPGVAPASRAAFRWYSSHSSQPEPIDAPMATSSRVLGSRVERLSLFRSIV